MEHPVPGRRRKTAKLIGVLALLGVGIALIAVQLRPEEAQRDPIALWVCDTCGAPAREPLENVSHDCRQCDKGQMVQRVFYRCERCGTVFEAYQVNWSPQAPRAAEERKGAIEPKPLRECIQDPLLARRPGGRWAWVRCDSDDDILLDLACPRCGRASREKFTKLLSPSDR